MLAHTLTHIYIYAYGAWAARIQLDSKMIERGDNDDDTSQNYKQFIYSSCRGAIN